MFWNAQKNDDKIGQGKIAEDDSIFDDIHKDTMMQTWKK